MPDPVHVPRTDPYPWPYDGQFDPAHLALVICGAQHTLIGASRSTASVAAVLDSTAAVVRQVGGSVVWIRHGSLQRQRRQTASLPTRRTTGWQIALETADEDVVIDAAGWDGCFASDLDHILRRRDVRTVALGGFASEITVDSTLRTLNDRGHECLVLTDACAPLDIELGRRACCSVTMSGGIFGALGTSPDLIAALASRHRESPCAASSQPLESELRP